MKSIMLRVFFLLTAVTSLSLHAETIRHFVTLSDIHFSPYVDCNNTRPCALIDKLNRAPVNQWAVILNAEHSNISNYHQDTNYPLLISALQSAKRTATIKQAQFVLVLGDTLAHSYRRLYKFYSSDKRGDGYQAFVHKTYQFINQELLHAFPNTDVYMVVGNNDSYRGDYKTDVHGAFFQNEGAIWSALIKNADARRSMRQVFSKAGYYAVTLPGDQNIRLIVLNTNLFSSKARGNNVDAAAMEQLKWLHHQLADVKKSKQTAWLAMHIPEGIDVFSTLHFRGLTLVQLWQDKYINEFQATMREYAPQVTAIFSGHLHSDWLQILRYDHSMTIPVTGTPSISPVYGNNPGYKLYTYSPTSHQLVDFATYYLPLGGQSDWSMEYQFSRVYETNCHDCPITVGINNIQKEGYLSDYYKLFYSVGTNSQPIVTQWNPYYWCAIWHIHPDAYRKCLS